MAFGIFKTRLDDLNQMIDENRLSEVRDELIKHRNNIETDNKIAKERFSELIEYMDEYKKEIDNAISKIECMDKDDIEDAKEWIVMLIDLEDNIINDSNNLIKIIKKEEEDVE